MKTENMSDDEKRVKIAEACGWTLQDFPNHQNGPKRLWVDPEGICVCSGTLNAIPDYLKDLNAMNEAENRPSVGRAS